MVHASKYLKDNPMSLLLLVFPVVILAELVHWPPMVIFILSSDRNHPAGRLHRGVDQIPGTLYRASPGGIAQCHPGKCC